MTKTTKTKRGSMAGGSWISKQRRLAIYLRDRFQCAYCGTDLHNVKGFDVTLDHLKCRKHGGDDSSANLVTACRSCNSGRGNKTVREYATEGAYLRIQRIRRRKLPLDLAKSILKGTANLDVEFLR